MAGALLVAGLGNPGSRYARTRHNAGFWLIERLAAQYRAAWHSESKFHGEICRLESPACWLLKPSTFMNHSGQSIAALAQFYRIPHSQILIVHDELDLLPGVARLKSGGGHGGHNGLRSIAGHLGNADFLRLRLGVGHPGQRDQVIDYVLHPPTATEQAALDKAIDEALGVLPLVLRGEWDKAMQKLHTGK
jgi:PTH1 family peptidyl-tRNA hydrolase